MLTERMMVQAIADRMGGIESTLKAWNFVEPWRSCWLALDQAPPGSERSDLIKLMAKMIQGQDGADIVMAKIMVAQAGEPLGHYPTLLDMDKAGLLEPVRWLWENWIPLGMLSLLTASPGAGKSMLALDLAARIIQGEIFPDGTVGPRPGAPVIYVDAEAIPQVHNERIVAWQADRDKLHIVVPKSLEGEMFIDLNAQVWRNELTEMVATVNPALVVIDSLSTVSLKGENNKEDVVRLLGFLGSLAQDFDCGLLLIHHLRKRGLLSSGDALSQDDVRGSGHIVAASRSVLGLSIVQTGPELDRNGPRRLEILKTNLTRYPKPIGVQMMPLHPKGVYLEYGDVPQGYQQPSEVELCADFMLETLQERGESIKPSEMVDLAGEEGYSRRTVYRARKSLEGQVVNTDSPRSPKNCWVLVG